MEANRKFHDLIANLQEAMTCGASPKSEEPCYGGAMIKQLESLRELKRRVRYDRVAVSLQVVTILSSKRPDEYPDPERGQQGRAS
ncbi:hypothetical protein [Thiocapsa bogorovii]|uniref:hypothetical protein n=1 Tax=Thiocapsa bogorovii TaxID=521689 RepID=UPI001E3C6D9E|nr:hypothetical protein [Thiocapsa bogorovii]UHD19039.1 hypothetical protein LT988_24460 [Thiocapsa bogorovii]